LILNVWKCSESQSVRETGNCFQDPLGRIVPGISGPEWLHLFSTVWLISAQHLNDHHLWRHLSTHYVRVMTRLRTTRLTLSWSMGSSRDGVAHVSRARSLTYGGPHRFMLQSSMAALFLVDQTQISFFYEIPPIYQ
jgi:hypothetical protein